MSADWPVVLESARKDREETAQRLHKLDMVIASVEQMLGVKGLAVARETKGALRTTKAAAPLAPRVTGDGRTNDDVARIVDLLTREGRDVKVRVIKRDCGLTSDRVKAAKKVLVASGTIVVSGTAAGARWALKKSARDLKAPTAKHPAAANNHGRSDLPSKDAVRAYLTTHREVTPAAFRDHFHISAYFTETLQETLGVRKTSTSAGERIILAVTSPAKEAP